MEVPHADGQAVTTQQPTMFSPDTLVSREEQCKNQAENFNYSLQKTIDEHGYDICCPRKGNKICIACFRHHLFNKWALKTNRTNRSVQKRTNKKIIEEYFY